MDNGEHFKSSYHLTPIRDATKACVYHSDIFLRKSSKGQPSTLFLFNECDQQIPPTHAIKGSSVCCPRTFPHSAKVKDPSTDCLINGAPGICLLTHGFASFILTCLLFTLLQYQFVHKRGYIYLFTLSHEVKVGVCVITFCNTN